jgi:hypothetical protein
MNAQLRSVLIGIALVAGCGHDRVITEKDPFKNLLCQDQLTRQSASFADATGLEFGAAEFSVLLTNERLNFILARAPDSGEIYATAIARSEASADEAELVGRFLSSLGLHCEPSPG